MEDVILFESPRGAVTTNSLLNTLQKCGAGNCRHLFIHSELNFGLPNLKLKRQELLTLIWDVFQNLDVDTLLLPAFTFSFCNHEVFDVQYSKTPMGALPEFVRQLPGIKRSADPMLSVLLSGKNPELLDNLSSESCGKGSIFDKLHRNGETKFLFMGLPVWSCFTYLHYVEWMQRVPYRYERRFSGMVINGDECKSCEVILPVCYEGVEPFSTSDFDEILQYQGALVGAELGDSTVKVVDENLAYKVICRQLKDNPDYFLAQPYSRGNLSKKYIFEKKTAL